MTERTQTQETAEGTPDEPLACLECGGNVVADGERNKRASTGCGPVTEDDETARTYRHVARELGLETEPADPESYLPRFVSGL